ncbi:MAG: TRL-like protein family [Lentisphaerae bacterium GWF2_57_35]|nr:MAG: TRL-like protein family [Lentisphaerae bacterium GWF2_57_35]
MKRITSMALCSVFAVGVLLVSGCASPFPMGAAYTELKLPGAVTSNAGASKVGVSQCTSILGLVATGDASIAAAMSDGGITKIHHVDWDAKNILGIYGQYKTTVYGD